MKRNLKGVLETVLFLIILILLTVTNKREVVYHLLPWLQ